jgi:general secretion pathway protein E
MIEADNGLRRLINEGASELDLETYARLNSSSIHEHGRARILAGETSVEEVLRVTTLGEGVSS